METQNIIEKSYKIAKELVNNKTVTFTNQKMVTCQMAILEYEDNIETGEEQEVFVTYTDGHNRVQMKNIGQLNPGLIHSFIIGLMRNL
jgi:hypothetical protein